MKIKKISIIGAALAVFILAAVAIIANLPSIKTQPPKGGGKIDMEPLLSDSVGVDLSSGFKILCDNSMAQSALENTLSVSPQESYSIEKVSTGEFHIRFDRDLKPDSIYRFSFDDGNRSWAFQTKKAFSLSRTMPRDKSTYVPTDTGIELTFSHEEIKNLEEHFEISPPVKGHFIYHHKTAIFMPEKELEPGTIYTVTVKKGLELKGSSDVLEGDHSFTFETQRAPGDEIYEYLNFTETLYSFTPDREPVLDVYASQDLMEQELRVTVLKYPDEEKLFNNLKQFNTPSYRTFGRNSTLSFDGEGLTKVLEFNTSVRSERGNYWYTSYILLPSLPGEGHYLVNIESENETYQTHIQISSLSVYAMAGMEESLVWVNGADTGDPVEGAVISIVTEGKGIKEAATTDREGIAVFFGLDDYLGGERFYLKIDRDTEVPFIVPFNLENWEYSINNDPSSKIRAKYWSYLYTDRGMYLPEDTIEVWGFIRPRSGKDYPSKGTLALHSTRYFGETNDKSILTEQIEISDLGTYQGKIQLSGFTPGSYTVKLEVEGQIVVEKYLEIRRYTKPAYRVDLSTDRRAMFLWETLHVDVSATFFEGTPVSGLELDYSWSTGWDSHNSGVLSCDEKGEGFLTIVPETSVQSWHPIHLNLHMNNAKAEEEEIHTGSHVTVFPRDTMIEIDTSYQSRYGKGLLEITTSLIDLERINNRGGELYYDIGDYRGDQVDIPLLVRIFEQHWEREETGEFYDFINKKVVKTYSYYAVQTPLEEFNINTSKGKYLHEFPMAEDENYVIEVTGYDSKGMYIFEKMNLFSRPYPNGDGGDFYTLDIVKQDPTLQDIKFDLGDEVSLEVKKNDLSLSSLPKERFLYMTLKNGLFSYTVSREPVISFEYLGEYIPNIQVKSVYFDGSHALDVGTRGIFYDYSSRELNINIIPDRDEYKPGDTAELDIKVEDIKGIPVAGAEVNISVVDEAYFAIYDQHVETLSTLYQSSNLSGIAAEYFSYKPITFNYGMPEMGGEGGSEAIRSEFKDNAFFYAAMTDRQGRAKVQFKVPDNLTTWRVTYQGISLEGDGLRINAGNGKIPLTVRLPFYTDLIFNDIFIEEDGVSISARSFGTEIDMDTPVDYEVLLKGEDTEKVYNGQGMGTQLVNIPLGKLKRGDYSVTVMARQKDREDGIKRDFKVVESMLEAVKSESFKLTDSAINVNWQNLNSLATVTLCNDRVFSHYSGLYSLMYGQGERVDQKLARYMAKTLMEEYYPSGSTGFFDREDWEFGPYQLYNGGIALLTYDDSSPGISAKIASLTKDLKFGFFDETALIQYFYSVLDDINTLPEDMAPCLWGLASLNEPVLIDMENFLKLNLNIKEKLYLAMGLAELGSLNRARDIFEEILGEYGNGNDSYIYLKSAGTRDDTIELTALGMVLAVKINAPEKDSLFKYISDNSTETLLVNMEKLIYLANTAPDTDEKGSFTMEIDGEAKNIELSGNEIYEVTLSPKSLRTMELSPLSGDITVTISHMAPIIQFSDDANKLVKIQRNYTLEGVTGFSFPQSSLIKVTLTPRFEENAPDGFYVITDILPAGIKYVSHAKLFDRTWHPGEVSGQRLVFGFYYNKKAYEKNLRPEDKEIVYYGRGVTPGEFTADYTYIKHVARDVSGYAGREKVTIGE